MTRLFLAIAALIAFSVAVQAQYDSNQVRKVNSLPATCTAGTTNAVVYQGMTYHCTATNTWSNVTGTVTDATGTVSGKAKLGQLPTSTYAGLPTCAAGNDGQMYRVTDANRDVYSCYGTSGKWVSRNGGVYNVRDFGAVGDGTMDASTAFTAMFTAAASNSHIVIPSGTYRLDSPASIANVSNVTIEAAGATIVCNAAAHCMQIGTIDGSSASASLTSNVTLHGATFKPGTNSSGYAMLAVNANNTITRGIRIAANSSYTFQYYYYIGGDEHHVIDDFNVNFVPALTSKGVAIYAPGPFPDQAAIITINNSNLALQCRGNGIDVNSSNTLTLNNVVIEGYEQFGVRALSDIVVTNNAYLEPGACVNPDFSSSMATTPKAGYILKGGTLQHNGGKTFSGGMPQFAVTNAGSSYYSYYVVFKNSSAVAKPLPIGFVANGNASIGVSNTVSLQFWQPADAATFDILRVTSSDTFPQGTGSWAITTAAAVGSYCSGSVCSFTDNVASPTSYTTGTTITYFPLLSFWPTAVVLTGVSDSTNPYQVARYRGGWFAANSAFVDSGYPSGYSLWSIDSAVARSYQNDNEPSTGIDARDLGSYSAQNAITPATLMPSFIDSHANTGLKGRLNFGGSFSSSGATASLPLDVVTIYDSALAKTLANKFFRPAWDVADTAIGRDTNGGYLRGQAFSFYSSLPDTTASNYDARWNSSGEWSFAKKVTFNAALSLVSVAATNQTGSVSLDLSTGNIRTVTFGAGNITTFTVTNVPVGPVWIGFIQDGTGGRVITTWNALFLFAGGTKPFLSTAANARDQFQFLCDGTNCILQNALYDVK